jgi:hypothetical protein
MESNWKYKTTKQIAKENWINFIVIVLIYMILIVLASIVIYSFLYEGRIMVNQDLN